MRCSHCARLHETLAEVVRNAPAGRVAVESRQLPLDGACNPAARTGSADPVRCLAARARICVESTSGASAYDTALYARQATLTPEEVLQIGARFVPRAELERCLSSPQTERALADDVAAALRYVPEGVPVVLLNGRLGEAFPPFLYAMALSGGNPDDPAFASLPPPRAPAGAR